jgi:RNA-directed DNA polymerase
VTQRQKCSLTRVSDLHRQERSHADPVGLWAKASINRGEESFEAVKSSPQFRMTSHPTEFEAYFEYDRLCVHLDALLDGHFDVIAERPRVLTGADRIELNHFVRDKVNHLSAISRKVLDGRYTFSPFLQKSIPKPDSKETRIISFAGIRDSIVQRAIYEYVYPVVDSKLSDSVFGYRKGKSAHDAVRSIRKHIVEARVYVFDADLRKFFDTVDHAILLARVEELGLDQRANKLIWRFLKTGRVPPEQVLQHRERKGKQLKYTPIPTTIGVPQGGVLSGLLSNLFLSGFDSVIREGFAGYVRYADDFLVCCDSEIDCRRVHELVKTQLEAIRLQLNNEKTKECVLAASGVDFLGFNISSRGVRVRSRNIVKFKARVRQVLVSQRILEMSELTLKSLTRRLMYKICGPSDTQIRKMADRGKRISRCRRSWIGFFRIVDDHVQIRALDHWLRQQVSLFMWRKHKARIRHREMRQAGLTSLMRSLWVARSQRPPPII